MIDAPCPGLDTLTEDDEGNLYASNWVFAVSPTLANGAAHGCIVKIPAGSDALDPSFKLEFRSLSGGHEGAAFRHLHGTTFLMSIFDESKVPFDPSAQTIFEWTQADSWRYATYDIATQQYKLLENLPWSSGGYYNAKLGERFYLMSPGANYESTTYLQLLPDGTVKEGLHTDGWSLRLFQVP